MEAVNPEPLTHLRELQNTAWNQHLRRATRRQRIEKIDYIRQILLHLQHFGNRLDEQERRRLEGDPRAALDEEPVIDRPARITNALNIIFQRFHVEVPLEVEGNVQEVLPIGRLFENRLWKHYFPQIARETEDRSSWLQMYGELRALAVIKRDELEEEFDRRAPEEPREPQEEIEQRADFAASSLLGEVYVWQKLKELYKVDIPILRDNQRVQREVELLNENPVAKDTFNRLGPIVQRQLAQAVADDEQERLAREQEQQGQLGLPLLPVDAREEAPRLNDAPGAMRNEPGANGRQRGRARGVLDHPEQRGQGR